MKKYIHLSDNDLDHAYKELMNDFFKLKKEDSWPDLEECASEIANRTRICIDKSYLKTMNEKTVTLGGREYTSEELRAELEKIEGHSPKKGDKYWAIDTNGSLKNGIWSSGEWEKYRLKTGNYWIKKPSQEEVDMWNLRIESLQYINMNKSFVVAHDNYMNRCYQQTISGINYEVSKYTILDFIPEKYHKAWGYEYTNVKPK